MRHYLCTIAAAGIVMGIGFSAMMSEAQQPKPEEGAVGLANPAAVFCVEQGGRYEIRDAAAGSQGFCILPDGAEVDAWTYFREHAPPQVK